MAVGRPRWSRAQVVVRALLSSAAPDRPLPYRVDTSEADRVRWYTCTLLTWPSNCRDVPPPVAWSPPMVSGPPAFQGVESVPVAASEPFTYRLIESVAELNTPTRWVHTLSAGLVLRWAESQVAEVESALAEVNDQPPKPPEYCSSKPGWLAPLCETASEPEAVLLAARLTQADTE